MRTRASRRTAFVALFIIITPIILLPEAPFRVSPWAHETHREIARDSLKHLPSDLRDLLERNMAKYLEGAVAPDVQFRDFVNHVWHVDEDYGNAVEKIASEAEVIKRMIRQKASEGDIAFEFGVILHYITDINNPLHTSGKDPNEENYHSKFEDYADSLLPIRYEFDGAENVSDIRQRMIQTATWAYQYYDEIRNIYSGTSSSSKGKYCGSKNSDVYHYPTCRYVQQIKPEDLVWFTDECDASSKGYRPCKVCNPPTCTGSPIETRRLDPIIQSCYSHAVKDVVSIFSTIWVVSKIKLKSLVTIMASSNTIVVGEELVLSGSLEPKRAGFTILIYKSSTGIWSDPPIYTALTDSQGRFSARLKLESAGTAYFKAVFAGDSEYEGNESNIVTVRCLKKSSTISLTAPKTHAVFSNMTVSGSLNPPVSQVSITITCLKPDGLTLHSSTFTDAEGRFSSTFFIDAVGEWRFAASWQGDDLHEGAVSEVVILTASKASSTLSIQTIKASVAVNEEIEVSGSISKVGKLASISVIITYTKPDGSEITRRVLTSSDGIFSDSVIANAAGEWKIKASWSGDEFYNEVVSETIRVTVAESPLSMTSIISIITIVAIVVVIRTLVLKRKPK
ncbi:MAG: zinc dependent phospholipase C family protein [Candidatus Brockarchaeota archaeon]|nr:zinc dependent phospholipase C family protein [Candidatus Brockarchaeota archaeon]